MTLKDFKGHAQHAYCPVPEVEGTLVGVSSGRVFVQNRGAPRGDERCNFIIHCNISFDMAASAQHECYTVRKQRRH